MGEIEKMLDKQVEVEIENLALLEAGSPEKAAAIEELTKLHKLRVEELKVRIDEDDKCAMYTLKKSEQKTNQFLQAAKIAGEIVIGVGGLVLWWGGYKAGLKFEMTGTPTSSFWKALISKKPGK